MDLVPIGSQLPAIQAGDDAKLDKLAGSGFLPYIQLVGSSSKVGKSGKFPLGQWALAKGKDNLINLTQSFECLVLARRPCAKLKTSKGIFTYYDAEHPEYKKIVELCKGTGLTGGWHGTEYLHWIQGYDYCTYHASNPTARTASQELNTILKVWRDQLVAKDPKVQNPQVKFTAAMITYSNGNEQHGPVFTRATTPFSVLPKYEEMCEQSEKFIHPATSKVETVAASEDLG